MDPELVAVFPWWAAAEDGQPGALRTRALAWLEGPNARIAAQARLFSPGAVEEVLDTLRNTLQVESVEGWDDPVTMEAWLHGLVEGCAASVLRRNSN